MKDVSIRLPLGFVLLHLEDRSAEDLNREYVVLGRDAEMRIQELENRLDNMRKHPHLWDADDEVFYKTEVVRTHQRIRMYQNVHEIFSAQGFSTALMAFASAYNLVLMHDALQDPEEEEKRLAGRREELKELFLKDEVPPDNKPELKAYFHAWMGLQEAAAPVLHRLCAD